MCTKPDTDPSQYAQPDDCALSTEGAERAGGVVPGKDIVDPGAWFTFYHWWHAKYPEGNDWDAGLACRPPVKRREKASRSCAFSSSSTAPQRHPAADRADWGESLEWLCFTSHAGASAIL